MVIGAIESKVNRESLVKHKRKPTENVCKIYFPNRAMELVNLPFMLNNSQLVSLLKYLPCNFVTPTVVYSLLQPKSFSIFNFKKFVWGTNVDQFLTEHCVKSIQIRSFFCSVFSCIRAEYGDLLHKSLYSIRNRKIRTRKSSVFGHFSRSGTSQSAITCSKLAIETLEKGVKYVQS